VINVRIPLLDTERGPNRHLLALAGAVAFTLCAILIYRWLRPISITEHARIFLQAVTEGDGSTLMHYALDEEIRDNDLTADKLSQLYKNVLLKDMSAFHPDGPVQVELLGHGDSAIAEQPLVDDRGRRFNYSAVLQSTDDGPKSSVISPIVRGWIGKHMIGQDIAFSVPRRMEAQLKGLHENRPYLDQLHVKSMVFMNVVEGKIDLISLDRLEQGWTKKASLAASR
jgi:hypothetical protein